MRVDSNSCGDVAEDGAKTAQWAVFSSAARDIHPRPPKNLNVCKYAEVFVLPGILSLTLEDGFEQLRHRSAGRFPAVQGSAEQ